MTSTSPPPNSTISVSQVQITYPTVAIEVSPARNRDSITGTKVLSVSFGVPPASLSVTGQWVVSWDNMYADISDDVRSARSEKGSYFTLQRGASTPGAGTPIHEAPEHEYTIPPAQPQPLQPTTDYTDGAPLSTAKLLAFENGLGEFEETEDLSTFFASRPIVQAPTHIIPNVETGKAAVYFLITGTTPLPDLIRVTFVPTWGASRDLATIPVPQRTDYTGHGSLHIHTAWAESRIDDLRTLEEIARELEREGARGLGTGRVKVGVEGGGMDEEAVRREGWMVGEEMVWVREAFLNRHIAEETSPLGLGLGLGLSLDTSGNNSQVLKLSTNVSPGGSVRLAECNNGTSRGTSIHQEEEDDLFALPLSPRSPDMAMSPFSMFRGEALEGQRNNLQSKTGGKLPNSRLNQVVSNIDTSLSPSSTQGGSNDVTPTAGSGITPTIERLKLGGGYAPLTPPIDRVDVGKE